MAYYQNNYRRNNRNRMDHIINELIKADELRVVMKNENLGVMPKSKALALAKENDMDLILIAEKAQPPVAKIMEYAKFKYQEQQKAQKSKAKSKKQELKEFRLTVNTGENDVNMKVERARKFLKGNDKVRFNLRFRGRENAHKELGYDKLNLIVAYLEDVAKIEGQIKSQGSEISVTLMPK